MSKHQHTPTILIDDRKILLLPFHSQNIPLLFSANVVDLNSSRSASLISGELPAVSAYGCVMVDAILWTSQPNNLYLQRQTTRSVQLYDYYSYSVRQYRVHFSASVGWSFTHYFNVESYGDRFAITDLRRWVDGTRAPKISSRLSIRCTKNRFNQTNT